MSGLQDLFADDTGSVIVEYGIITAIIGFTCIAAFFVLSNVVNTEFQTMSNGLSSFETGQWP